MVKISLDRKKASEVAITNKDEKPINKIKISSIIFFCGYIIKIISLLILIKIK
jgi:hypothetical protein